MNLELYGEDEFKLSCGHEFNLIFLRLRSLSGKCSCTTCDKSFNSYETIYLLYSPDYYEYKFNFEHLEGNCQHREHYIEPNKTKRVLLKKTK